MCPVVPGTATSMAVNPLDPVGWGFVYGSDTSNESFVTGFNVVADRHRLY